MAELGQIEDAPPATADTGAKRNGGGRGLTALALLLSLAAAATAGYSGWLAWRVPNAAAIAELHAELAAQEQRQLATTQARQAELRDELRTEFEATAQRTEEQVAALQQSQAEIRDRITEAQNERPYAEPGRWRVAEAEYLMRIANHRLLMERDADAAENLLAMADHILVEVDALAYHDVRALLAREMALLRAFEGVDAQGVFLRLEALKGLLDQLPLRLPAYSAPRQGNAAAPPETNTPPTLLEALAARLGGLVRFRRHDGEPARALLPPRQAEYLQMHLRLALDRAQLAALRHDQAIYRASLAAAQDWLRRFVDPTRPATEQLVRELGALHDIAFDTQRPDISQSLARLRELEAAAPGEPPAP